MTVISTNEEAKGKRSPFWIESLKPIQPATFDLEEYQGCRAVSSLRMSGSTCCFALFEPSHFQRRLKLLFPHRLLLTSASNLRLIAQNDIQ
jgi:ATP-dependent Lon protease